MLAGPFDARRGRLGAPDPSLVASILSRQTRQDVYRYEKRRMSASYAARPRAKVIASPP
jgi:hypothetical protein